MRCVPIFIFTEDALNTIRLPFLDPVDFENVLIQVGFCLWQIQSLEYTFAQYLVFVHEYDPSLARIEIQQLFERVEKKTFGQLVARLKQKVPQSEPLLQQTERFVEKRNWLVHRSRLQSETELYSPGTKASLLKRIKDIADESLELNKAFGSEVEKFFLSHGLTKDDIDKRTQALIDSWTS